jgi:hypothetical protein
MGGMGGAGSMAMGSMGTGDMRMGGRGMSGMGSGSTGMGHMRGMMGDDMGGGMMRGMGGMYDGLAPSAAGLQQTATLKLTVDLPGDVEPAAEEFLKALVQNLRQALLRAYEAHVAEVEALVTVAESRRDEIKESLDMAMGLRSPEARFILDRLEQIVDLSVLTPDMPFGEAI